MKEYWVNVYNYGVGVWAWRSKYEVEGVDSRLKVNYRLHVREFETREAKELYLKMKYSTTSIFSKDQVEGMFK